MSEKTSKISYEKAILKLENFLRYKYNVGIEDVELTDTRGYWQFKKPCTESCHHPIHGCIGNSERSKHTIEFTPLRRDKGRFVSKYEVWDIINEKEQKGK